jgi:hypothetical protein
MDSIAIKLMYDGIGPVTWSRDPRGFGVQDEAGALHPGSPGPNDTVVFELTFQAKSNGSDLPVLIGTFAHGPPRGRFIYLGWRNDQGGLAQRLKLPLGTITWSDIREAIERKRAVVGTLVDHHPKATSTGANIGGSRPISWTVG